MPFLNLHLLLPILVGALASGAAALHSRTRGAMFFRRFWGLGLMIAAVIYVVFALVWGGGRSVAIELLGLVIFALLAWIGVFRWPFALALGWLIHVAWDVTLHPMHAEAGSYAPWWYPGLCVGFDLVVAGFLAATFSGRRSTGGDRFRGAP